MPPSPTTTIVVPCYQEAERLNVAAFASFLQRAPDLRFVLVDDGSADDTFKVLTRIASFSPARVRVLRLEQNSGKAEAVRQGVLAALAAGSDFVGYWDADLATPLEVIPEFLRVLAPSDEFDIVIGARVALLGRRIERKLARHYAGRIFATAASLTLNLPVYDTQCGAKLFRVTPATRALFERPFGSRWIFDVELLARYLSSGGDKQRLYELALPVWTDVGESKVKPVDFARAVGEMLTIYRNYDLRQWLRPLILPLTGLFSRYVGVGGLGTILHYAILVLSVELLGIAPQVAAVLGAAAGSVVNYLLNYTITFSSQEAHRRAAPKFAFVALVSVLASGYGVRTASRWGIHYLPAQLACTLLVLVAGFFINRAWTFAPRRARQAALQRAAEQAAQPTDQAPAAKADAEVKQSWS